MESHFPPLFPFLFFSHLLSLHVFVAYMYLTIFVSLSIFKIKQEKLFSLSLLSLSLQKLTKKNNHVLFLLPLMLFLELVKKGTESRESNLKEYFREN